MTKDGNPNSRTYATRSVQLPDVAAAVGHGLTRFAQVEPSVLSGRALTADVDAVIAEGRGVAALGKGIQDFGDAGQRLHLEVQRAKAITAENDADLHMLQLQNEARKAMVNEPDEDKWEGIARGYVEKFNANFAGRKMPEFAREAISHKAAGWGERFVGNVLLEAAGESRRKAGAAFSARYSAHLESGDYEGAATVNRQMTAAGYQGPDQEALNEVRAGEHKKRREEESRREARQAEIDRLRTVLAAKPEDGGGPFAAKDALDAGHFNFEDATDKLNAEREVERAIREAQQEAVLGPGGLRDRVITGEAVDIEAEGKALRLGAEEVAELKEWREKLGQERLSKEPMDLDAAAKLNADISAFDPDEYADPKDALKAYGELLLRSDLLSARGGELGHKTGGVWSQRLYQKHPMFERRPAGQEAEAVKIFHDLLDAALKDGSFGEPTEQRKVKRKKMEFGKEVEEDVFEDAPRTATHRQHMRQSYYWEPLLLRDIRDGKVKPDFDSVNEWLGKRIGTLRAGERLKATREANAGPSSPLLPPAGWDASGGLNKITE